jgi:glycosyltransferase involved in cell wall biosynthesis
MRIALVAPPWVPVPPPAYGGTEAVVDTLARGLREAGHDVVLAASGDSTCPVERIWLYGRAQTPLMGNTYIELRHALHAYKRLADDDVDVVHDHTVAGPLLAERFGHRVVVTTNHGPFTTDATGLYRWTVGRVPIIAISHHQAAAAGNLPIARVIHHGVDTSAFPVGAGRDGYALFLGRMSPDKGVGDAIRIARAAGMPLRIAAKMREPAELDYYRAEIEPLLSRDICYVGEVGGADKLALLGGALALLNPLRWDEPFGMCMIEALACGTPVVATPRGAVPEIVDDGLTGFIRARESRLADALQRAEGIDRRACRAAVEQRFSMQRMARDHIALYDDLIGGERSSHRATVSPLAGGWTAPLAPGRGSFVAGFSSAARRMPARRTAGCDGAGSSDR